MVGVEPRVVRVVRAAVAPGVVPTSVSKRLTGGKWADLLGRFRHALAAGAIYDRELVQLVEPLGGVLEHEVVKSKDYLERVAQQDSRTQSMPQINI